MYQTKNKLNTPRKLIDNIFISFIQTPSGVIFLPISKIICLK